MVTDLLPPNASALERGLARVSDRIGSVPVDLLALWNPATCPIDLLPWLAWALSIDRWESGWSDAQKREAVADAIAVQRRKGTRPSVEAVLASFDDLLQLVEWFDATPALDPYTFEIRLALIDADGIAGGTRVTADFARAIVREVSRVKPARAHFRLVQELEIAGIPAPLAAATGTGYRRLDLDTTGVDATPWSALIQDENGEPLVDDSDEPIDGTAA